MKCIIWDELTKKTFDNVLSVSLPASSGQMQFLFGHVESFAKLAKGNIKIASRDGIKKRKIKSGVCYAKDNLIKIFAID